ncbi:MAG: RsmB/NOP family class I SAM-dependent RNA methyltransferase [Phycisphaerales bacterium]|nr:RsmB/NOP family class I SAM-dependent RNA methyltransferase [Phycisphaerales bacterium]
MSSEPRSLTTPTLPARAVERFIAMFGEEGYAEIAESLTPPGRGPCTFRLNALRGDPSATLAEIEDAGMTAQPIHWCPLGYRVTSGTIRSLQALRSYESGALYIQAASSMVAAHALEAEPGDAVLDMCAAPGSKTSQLAAAMKNSGVLVANDRSRKRLYKLREILQKQGATCVEVLCGDGERLGKSHADCFDRVLVDAPCSGEGRFRLDRPMRIARWSEREIRTLARQQERLLIAALRCVKPGGLVVYSTCTFAPEENERVLDRVLCRDSIDASIEPLPDAIRPPSARDPLQAWESVSFQHDLRGAIRIMPDDTTGGFFIARIRRR